MRKYHKTSDLDICIPVSISIKLSKNKILEELQKNFHVIHIDETKQYKEETKDAGKTLRIYSEW